MRSALFICALLASTGSASAQWQVTASLGKAATSPSGLSIRSAADSALTVDRVHVRDESFDTPWYYGARLTRRLEVRISTHLAAVVEFKLTRTRQQLDVGSADIEGVFTTRHVLAGLVWQTTRAIARSCAETQPWRR